MHTDVTTEGHASEREVVGPAQRLVVSALVVAARAGLPVDVQEVLIHGDPVRGVPAGILAKMLLFASVWRCWHCGFVATNEVEARAHFGPNAAHPAECQMKDDQ